MHGPEGERRRFFVVVFFKTYFRTALGLIRLTLVAA
jgi:hypothetical protein